MLSEFFGKSWSQTQMIQGTMRPIPQVGGDPYLPAEPFAAMADEQETPALEAAFSAVADNLGGANVPGTPRERMKQVLESGPASVEARLLRASSVDGQTRAVSLGQFGRDLFGPEMEPFVPAIIQVSLVFSEYRRFMGLHRSWLSVRRWRKTNRKTLREQSNPLRKLGRSPSRAGDFILRAVWRGVCGR